MSSIISTIVGIVTPLAEAYRAWKKNKAAKRRRKKEARERAVAEAHRINSMWAEITEHGREVGARNLAETREKVSPPVTLDRYPFCPPITGEEEE